MVAVDPEPRMTPSMAVGGSSSGERFFGAVRFDLCGWIPPGPRCIVRRGSVFPSSEFREGNRSLVSSWTASHGVFVTLIASRVRCELAETVPVVVT